MARTRKYSSNAEKQAAYRARKRNANVTKRNKKVEKPNPKPKPQDVDVDDIADERLPLPTILDKPEPELELELSSLVGIVKNVYTLKHFKESLTQLQTLESTRLLSKLNNGSKNNTQYIERIINDMLRSLIDLGWIRNY